ncbi:MAG: hypothetical protein RL662_1542 [Bacteroidota bacterium]|jgi:acetyltransferase-like isoleucine patch superfamily enzyme
MIKKLYWILKTNRIKKKLASCGDNTTIDKGAQIAFANCIFIANNVYIGPDSWISAQGGLLIEEGVIIGPRVRIHTMNHNYKHPEALPYDGVSILKKVSIKKNVWIGADVTLLPGVEVGEGSIIAAGSVVTKSIPPLCIVGGNPSKKIGQREPNLYYKLCLEGNIYLKLKKEKKISFKAIRESRNISNEY